MGYQAAPIFPLLLEDKGSNILFIFTNILFLFSVLFQLFHNLKKKQKDIQPWEAALCDVHSMRCYHVTVMESDAEDIKGRVRMGGLTGPAQSEKD